MGTLRVQAAYVDMLSPGKIVALLAVLAALAVAGGLYARSSSAHVRIIQYPAQPVTSLPSVATYPRA